MSPLASRGREPKRLRFQRAIAVVVAGIGVLFLGVGRLQLVEHDRYQNLAQRNYVRLEVLRAPRGRIVDRNQVLLADNRPSFSVVFTPPPLGSTLPDTLESHVTARLCTLLAIPDSLVRDVTRRAVQRGLPIAFAKDVPLEVVSVIEEELEEFPGIEVQLEPRRSYPNKMVAAHFLGYAGEISSGELEKLEEKGYRSGDLIGRTGLERTYEEALRGTDGREVVVVTATGRRVSRFDEEEPIYPVPGKDLVLTLDIPFQIALEEAMERVERGAAVAIDPRTGGILAMASRPSFDPNEFARGLSTKRWNELVSDQTFPLLNRAVQSAYPPASTYKILVSLGALGDGLIRPEDPRVFCPGGFPYGGRYYRCWLHSGHGSMAMRGAIAYSCDVYYYQLGLRMGVATLANWSRRFGLGEATGVDLPSERSGLVPDGAWFDENRGQGKWKEGVVVNLSIGQGELLTTPLQLAHLTAIVANRGIERTPHFVHGERDPETGAVTPFEREPAQTIALARQHWDSVIAAMEYTVDGGTGGLGAVPDVRVAGKTGTGQNPHGEDHAVFVAFAPVDEPTVALVIFAENAGGGGSVAAPIAGAALRAYLRPDLPAVDLARVAVPDTTVEAESSVEREN